MSLMRLYIFCTGHHIFQWGQFIVTSPFDKYILNIFLLSFPTGDFIYKVSSLSPTKHFIIHSRKALLNARISPADNRKIPPLK